MQPLERNACISPIALSERGPIIQIHATVLAPRDAEKDFQRELRRALKNAFPDIKDLALAFEDSRNDKRMYVLLVATSSKGIKL